MAFLFAGFIDVHSRVNHVSVYGRAVISHLLAAVEPSHKTNDVLQ